MAMQSGFIKRIRDIMRMDAGINGDAQRIEQMVWMLFLKVYDAKEDDWELNEDNYESIIPEDLRWRNWAKADSNGHAMTGDKLLNFVNNTLFPVLKGNDVKEGDTIVYEGIKVTPDPPIKKAIVKSTFEDANNYMKDGVYLRQVIDVIDEIEFDAREFCVIFRDLVDEHVRKNGIRRADTDSTRRGLVDLFQFVFRRFQLTERAFDDVEYLLAALFGKFHAAVRAVEQRRIQLPFQLFDRLRDRRLADKKFLRRARQTAALRDGIKDAV